jgi:hypothetical protein
MSIKTVRDAIEKLQQYDPDMLIGSSKPDSWGNEFCELAFDEEFVDDKNQLIDIFPHTRPTQKVLVIY